MEVFANVALDGHRNHSAVSFPATARHCANIGANYRTGVCWHRTRGRTCEEHRTSNNSNFYSSKEQAKTESLCFLSAHSSAGLVTSSVSQRPEPRAGIKKHRARSVYYQLHILYAMRRHKHPDKEAQVTQPPEGYFWAVAEEETEENKYVISRRLEPSRWISWIIIESHREELILEWAPINGNVSGDLQSSSRIRYSVVPLSELCGGPLLRPSSLTGHGWKINAANWQHLGSLSLSLSLSLLPLYQTGSITKAGLHSVALKKQEALSITAVCLCVCARASVCVCVCEVQAGLWWAERGGGGGNSLFASL